MVTVNDSQRKFFAHSTDQSDRIGWQPLDTHLESVAALASSFGSVFHAEHWAKLCGLLHDLGKYSLEFQRRLEGGPRVDHSTAGAKVAAAQLDKAAGRIIAHVVAGHHAGLPDSGSIAAVDRKTLEGRLRKSVPDLVGGNEIMSKIADPDEVPVKWVDSYTGFTIAFFVRMLFSCLTDADYLDTEAWLKKDRAKLRGTSIEMEQLLECLDQHLDKKCNDSTPINCRRHEILENCRNAATLDPGIFSLTVPTGGGKTLSSLAFALRHAKQYGLRRVIYVIPYTSIITQNADVFRDAFSDFGDVVLEHHSNFQVPEDDLEANRDALKMRLASENWDAPIVVTTNVQFFESLFATKSSKSRKLHNISGSVVILDEAQMLPVNLLQPSIRALRELAANYQASVVLCTATQPALQRSRALTCGFEENEVREIVPNHEELYQAFRRVDVKYAGTITDEEIAQRICQEHQILCIVNTRSHARKLFEALGASEGNFHLSALMCPAHRVHRLKEIKRRLDNKETCRVISTQLVEAGVDVDFPVVFRAAAGIDSVAQAAGRCNREGRMGRLGQVMVFEPEHGLPPGDFRRRAQIGGNVARKYPEDLLSPSAVHYYFSKLYGIEDASGLDSKGILKLIEENAKSLSWPFREIARKYRLIEDENFSVVVPYDEQACKLIERLKFAEFPTAAIRKLQPYVVQVRKWTFAGMVNAGVVETIKSQFYVLTNDSLYRDNLGLCPENFTFRNQEDNVF